MATNKNIENTQQYLKSNVIITFLITDIVFIIIFFVMYLFQLNFQLNLVSVLDAITLHPVLIFLLLHPLLFVFILILHTNQTRKQIEHTTESLDYQLQKIDEVNTFIDQLREGQKTIIFSELFQKDRLVRSLLNLRDELEKSRKEEEIRKKEDQQRFWTNEGLAKFGATLRENVDNLENLAHEITKNITQYMNVQQAGFFVVTEEQTEKYIDMLSLFAFNRKKFPDKRFQWGEGLIGASAIEQKTIFLPQTTESYLEITSGLGKSNPRSVLIVPIKDSENVVHGVLEIASFKKFENYEIHFVEQVADSIGLTMATIKANLRTQELLKDSQKQAELLAEQEEVMRKNVEEIISQSQIFEDQLNITQKELLNIDNILYHFQISPSGNILFVNDLFLQKYGFEDKSFLIDKDFTSLIPKSDSEWFVSLWQEIISQKQTKIVDLKIIDSLNKLHWISSFFYFDFDQDNQIKTVAILATENQSKEEMLQEKQIIQSVASFAFVADFGLDGHFKYISENFLKRLGVSKTEIEKMTIFDFVTDAEKQQYETIWNNIIKGRKYRASRIFNDITKNQIVFDMLFTPVYNIDNNIDKVTMLAIDITDSQSIKEEYETIKNKFEKSQTDFNKLSEDFEERINNEKKVITKRYEKESEELINSQILMDNMDEAVLLVKEDYYIVYNKKAEELFGFKKDIVIGKKIMYLMPEIPEIKDETKYIRYNIDKQLENTEIIIVDRDIQKKVVLATTKRFITDNKNYLLITLKPQK